MPNSAPGHKRPDKRHHLSGVEPRQLERQFGETSHMHVARILARLGRTPTEFSAPGQSSKYIKYTREMIQHEAKAQASQWARLLKH